MNWAALGAISDLLSAVAVGSTLVFLVIELRQNTRAMRSTTFQAINDGMSRVTEIFATDSDLPRIMLEGQAGLEHLSPQDRVRFSFAHMMLMRRLQAVLAQEQFGMLGQDFVAAYERSVVSTIATAPGPREWWSSARHAFPSAFIERVDNVAGSGSLIPPRHVGLADDGSSL